MKTGSHAFGAKPKLAALNHPNIGHIHGLEKSDGTIALVMELVEGPTLADRIALGPIPLADALPIAKQIAEALEAAHQQGIIHRDLKPANIKVKDDGTVKVFDFGLAKAMDLVGASGANAMNSPALSIDATQAGIILGTAAYMSPEQAKGRPVDKRSDIWAFGCVLYEMLAGQRASAGFGASRSSAIWTLCAPSSARYFAAMTRLFGPVSVTRTTHEPRSRSLPDSATGRGVAGSTR